MLEACVGAAEESEEQAEPPLANVSLLQTFSQPPEDGQASHAPLFERSLPALVEEPAVCSPAGQTLLSHLLNHSGVDNALRPGSRPTAFRPESSDATAGSLLATLHSRSLSNLPAEYSASDSVSDKCASTDRHTVSARCSTWRIKQDPGAAVQGLQDEAGL